MEQQRKEEMNGYTGRSPFAKPLLVPREEARRCGTTFALNAESLKCPRNETRRGEKKPNRKAGKRASIFLK